MGKPISFGKMQSNRILLSDRHAHQVLLTEQEIGLAIHALSTLATAFSAEYEYKTRVEALWTKLSKQLDEQAIEMEKPSD